MVSTARLVATLGGRRVLRYRNHERAATLRERVRAGLPYAALEAVASRFEIAPDDLVQVLALPRRTLARRKKEGRLRPDESDRLLRFGRIVALAEEILGDREKATRWLHRRNPALGRETPLHHLDTDLGAREVEALLLRIAHGIPS